MRVIGLDPGLLKTGYGIVETDEKDKILHIESGKIVPPEKDFFGKINFIYENLISIIDEFSPDEAACETIFYGKSVKDLIKISHVRGVVLLALKRSGISIYEYSPSQVKKAVSGYGNASKSQVLFMVKKILDMPSPGSFDAADALAVALSHIMYTKSRRKFLIND